MPCPGRPFRPLSGWRPSASRGRDEGPYPLTRNPLHFFSFPGAAGLCLTAQNVVLALVTASGFLLCCRGVIDREETRLTSLFGNAFEAYRPRMPRFLPRIARAVRPEAVGVAVAVFERSLAEVGWFPAAAAALEAVEAKRLAGVLATGHTPIRAPPTRLDVQRRRGSLAWGMRYHGKGRARERLPGERQSGRRRRAARRRIHVRQLRATGRLDT